MIVKIQITLFMKISLACFRRRILILLTTVRNDEIDEIYFVKNPVGIDDTI